MALTARVTEVDVLRGFALAGILFANIGPVWATATGSVTFSLPWQAGLDLAVQGRFFPVFSFLFGAAASCGGLLLLLRTPARSALASILAPLGRLALTNYLAASVVIVACARAVDALDPPSRPLAERGLWVAVVMAVLLVTQVVLSGLWLRRFRYGPVEWVLRCLTWWRRVPLTRQRRPAGRGPDEPASHELPDGARRGAAIDSVSSGR